MKLNICFYTQSAGSITWKVLLWGHVQCGLYMQMVFIYRWSLHQVSLYWNINLPIDYTYEHSLRFHQRSSLIHVCLLNVCMPISLYRDFS